MWFHTRICMHMFSVLTQCILFFQQLIENLDRDLQYAIAVEGKLDIDSVTNYDEVKDAIKQKVPCPVLLWSLIFIRSLSTCN